MGKKKLKRRIAEMEAELAELYHKCRICESCENYKPKTVTWRRFRNLDGSFFPPDITCEAKGNDS